MQNFGELSWDFDAWLLILYLVDPKAKLPIDNCIKTGNNLTEPNFFSGCWCIRRGRVWCTMVHPVHSASIDCNQLDPEPEIFSPVFHDFKPAGWNWDNDYFLLHVQGLTFVGLGSTPALLILWAASALFWHSYFCLGRNRCCKYLLFYQQCEKVTRRELFFVIRHFCSKKKSSIFLIFFLN